jgi:hypothetical protein
MARYSVRDLLGHFVRPKSARGDLCPHSCCRNRRPHPENWPAYLKPRTLRTASDEDLAEHYVQHGGCEKCRGQILREMDRRDVREQRAKTARQRRFARSLERQEAIEASWQAAERATNGNMLNAKGRARGIDDRSLFTGSEDRAYRYASDELKAHWEHNPRPTRAQLSGDPEAIRRERSLSNAGRAQASRRPAIRSRTITTGRGKDRRTVHVTVTRKELSRP